MRKMPKTAEPGQGQETVSPPLSRTLRVDELEEGEEGTIEVNRAERKTIAALLDLRALDRLTFAFRLNRRGQGRLALQGTIAAAVTQTCVVSLEPVESTLEVPVGVEFWPVPMIDDLAASPDEAASHGTLDWPEPIEGGKIDLGPVIYETLATALDPYPKREGVSFEWSEAAGSGAEIKQAESPFAALKQLK
jgi:uncharacterized metal-binding protein YceD (DUF177 family)